MPSITFFGATGGCTLAALTKTLEADISATALVRSSSKLTKLLSERGVSESKIEQHLTIVEGDIKDVASVKKALLVPNSQAGAKQQISDIIVSGIGGTPIFSKPISVTKPITLTDPTICRDGTQTIVDALKELQKEGASGKPIFTAISTTGISRDYRDVPLAMVPLYHWFLQVPHEDKRIMESILEETAAQGELSPIKGYVSVKPSLLVDGDGVGPEKLRVGWERGEAEGHKPAVGYKITRNDVGAWIFKEIVNNEGREKWVGKLVSLTA